MQLDVVIGESSVGHTTVICHVTLFSQSGHHMTPALGVVAEWSKVLTKLCQFLWVYYT